jgi:hypothetical protein
MVNSPSAEDPQPDDYFAIHASADDSGAAPWIVVVVRAWTHEGRRVVRMTLAGTGRTAEVCYEPSSAAAGLRLARWLDDLPDHCPVPTATDSSGDEPETPWRRTDIAVLPTVAAGPATSVAEAPPPANEPAAQQPRAREGEGQQRRDEES